MLLKTQLLRGLFALPLLGLMLLAHSVLGHRPGPSTSIESAVQRLLDGAELTAEPTPACTDDVPRSAPARWLISTPADLPLPARARAAACPRT
ncbi:MAG: hypothetical protein ACK4RW_11685 [Rehaibacterium terrae]|uniref:hypothetical protein n=1 Tax=Rehaibacterium terrae TaxID=1341696 RepID=UPI00391AE68E